MPRKTKIILIITFILVGIIILGAYFYFKNKNSGTLDPNASIYQKFNPFGTSANNPTTPGTDTGTEGPTAEVTIKENSRFTKITNFAVAGAVFFEDTRPLQLKEGEIEQKFEIVPSLRYVERATGHVYQMFLDTKTEGKISNSTIPSIHETIFDSKANSIIYRYVSSDNNGITSFLASLKGKSSSFLAPDILAVSLSPDKNSFFSIIKNINGVNGVVKSFEKTTTSQVFTSPFSEWLPQWVTEKIIFLTTKPSYLANGSVFSLNITNGTLSKVFGGVAGLTTLTNNDGTAILYGASLDIGPKLNIFNIKAHTSVDLNTYGLPEKCIWSSDNINVYCAIPNTIVGTQYPDSWYQGLVSFEDRFVKINTQTGDVVTMANSGKETPIDATNLFLSDKEDKLFFINKKDGTLWSLDL